MGSSSSARPTYAASGSLQASAPTVSPAPAGWGSSSRSGSSRERRASTSGTWTRAASAPHTRARPTRSLARRRSIRPTTTSSTRATSGEAGRPLRTSPAYARLKELGAAFGEKSGWERANWFEPNAANGDESLRPRGWAGRHWSPAIGAEHRACREAAALFDESSFAKIEVSGEGAAGLLERLCDNRVARDTGAITYTQMLNAKGGIECDFTVTRLGEERFRIVTGTAFGRHDLAWIRQHAPDDGSVTVDDVTSKYACLGLWGPSAREHPGAAGDDAARLPLHAGARARGRSRPLSRAARDLRRRARLGALLPLGVRAGALGHDLGGGRGARAGRGRLQGDRLAAAREGLPRLGRPTSRPTTRRTRRGSASRSSSTRSSWARRRSSPRASPSGGSAA